MLRLYENPLSPYVQKVKIALYEKGLPFESKIPDLFGTPDEEFLRTSPRREIPTLVDGDLTLFDSTIILEYLEEKWPEPSLMPKALADRARVRMLEDLCDTYVEAITWGLVEVRFFGRAKGELGDLLLERAATQLKGVFGYLERQLGDRSFFDGETLGRGDLSVFPHVAAASGYGIAPPGGSKLTAWLGRVGSRPSAQKTLTSAKATLGTLPDLAGLVESGALIRQYRDHRLEWMMRSGGTQVVLDGAAKKTVRFSTELE